MMGDSIRLTRLQDDGIETTGVLEVLDGGADTVLKLCTLELPWNDNRHDISCIPAGLYVVAPYLSPHLGNVLEVKSVPDRSGIRIHAANFVGQLQGCIAVGLSAEDIDGDGEDDVKDSKAALHQLLARITDETLMRIIAAPKK
jgi:hypothetical protein